ncbi:hypothetical protein NP493_288g00020 [Ridgeia piscesae]|uniref:Reverse transcriptase n=1 Tax=Ridgeia piscesae TaxID=27915 RepID=A0AAD9NWW7_RIDPI|nr:hypothetical protein NP493_288g00020 [Ridgeia piscesae]
MLALLNDFASYQSYLSSVVRFSSWCSNNFLHLNVSKTKEMCIDFRRNRTVISPIVINGEPVEQVDSFKYLGVILDEKLSFTEHGLPTPKLSEIIDHAILKKARAVATESDHPLSKFFHVLPSQRRYRCIKCKTCRYSRSFVPVAIRMLNAK